MPFVAGNLAMDTMLPIEYIHNPISICSLDIHLCMLAMMNVQFPGLQIISLTNGMRSIYSLRTLESKTAKLCS